MSRALILLAALAVAADDPRPAAPKLSADEQAVLDATNAERRKAGLGELRPSAKLFEVARRHSENMAKQDTLSHELDGKTMADRVKAAGYAYRAAGENVAFNQKTPTDAVAGWMASEGHRANILNGEFTEIGVGRATNADGKPYWTQVFGTPK
jgi:uncharacterized protein YkwD